MFHLHRMFKKIMTKAKNDTPYWQYLTETLFQDLDRLFLEHHTKTNIKYMGVEGAESLKIFEHYRTDIAVIITHHFESLDQGGQSEGGLMVIQHVPVKASVVLKAMYMLLDIPFKNMPLLTKSSFNTIITHLTMFTNALTEVSFSFSAFFDIREQCCLTL